MSVYRLRWSSSVRKVMMLGSGSERRRCIMQFSLAAGSERAVREGGRRCQIQLWQDSFLTVLIFSSWSTVTHFGKSLNTHTSWNECKSSKVAPMPSMKAG